MRQSQSKPSFVHRVALGALAVGLLVGCSDPQEPVETPEPEVTEEAPEEIPEEEPGIWELTGVSGEVDERPVLSVKIENSSASRPQAGLEDADIVWEQLVEGGMTRFVAMFHSHVPETVGPIRSIRPMDAPIVGQVGGVLAFSGGQLAYQQRARDAGVALVQDDSGDAGFYRNPNRTRDHSLYGETEPFLAQDLDGPPELFSFADEEGQISAVSEGEEVNDIEVDFPASHPSWAWNGEFWERSESGTPALAESGERLQATNVVVLTVQVRDTGNRDGAGSTVYESVLTGEGQATVFSGGHGVPIRWEKGQDSDPLRLLTEDGDEVLLAPGNTWVELLPVSGSLTIS